MNNINSPSFFIGKNGDNLISFGSGQPDLPPPPEVYEIKPKDIDFRYGLIQGLTSLRAALAKQYHGAKPDNFVITNGASEALDLALRALYKKGAKVLLPLPYYYSYPHNVKFAGMAPEYYRLRDGKIDFNEFKGKIKGCRAVIINSPSNPTGTVQDLDALEKIEKLTVKLGVYVISDEVYKNLIYERENYLIKGNNVLTINSFSKTYSMCGFRVGYVYARKQRIINKIIEIKTHTSMNTNILGQEMALEAARVPKSFIDGQVKIWQKRRNLIYQGLKDLGFDLWKPEGAFYVFPKIKNSNQAVNDLYSKYQVIVYDGAWFGSPGRIRLSYALDAWKIKEGLKRIGDYIKTK